MKFWLRGGFKLNKFVGFSSVCAVVFTGCILIYNGMNTQENNIVLEQFKEGKINEGGLAAINEYKSMKELNIDTTSIDDSMAKVAYDYLEELTSQYTDSLSVDKEEEIRLYLEDVKDLINIDSSTYNDNLYKAVMDKGIQNCKNGKLENAKECFEKIKEKNDDGTITISLSEYESSLYEETYRQANRYYEDNNLEKAEEYFLVLQEIKGEYKQISQEYALRIKSLDKLQGVWKDQKNKGNYFIVSGESVTYYTHSETYSGIEAIEYKLKVNKSSVSVMDDDVIIDSYEMLSDESLKKLSDQTVFGRK